MRHYNRQTILNIVLKNNNSTHCPYPVGWGSLPRLLLWLQCGCAFVRGAANSAIPGACYAPAAPAPAPLPPTTPPESRSFCPLATLAFMPLAYRHTPGRAGHGGVWVKNQKVLAKKKKTWPPKAWWLQLTLMTTLGLTGINVMQSFCRFVGQNRQEVAGETARKIVEKQSF